MGCDGGRDRTGPVQPDLSGSGFAPKKERRFAAIVFWRRHLLSLSGRRGVLELKDGDFENTATLTGSRGEVLFTAPVGKVRCRRSWPYCFTIECDGKRWRMWGIGVNSRKDGAPPARDHQARRRVDDRAEAAGHQRTAIRQDHEDKMAQQKLWRELWLIALKAFGAKVV